MLPRIKKIEKRLVKADKKAFLELINRNFNKKNICILLSGGELDCSNNSFLGINPFLQIKIKKNKIIFQKDNECECFDLKLDIWQEIREIFKIFKNIDYKFCGAIGYFSYEVGNYIENLPNVEDIDNIYDIYFAFFRKFYHFDEEKKLLTEYDIIIENDIFGIQKITETNQKNKIFQKDNNVDSIIKDIKLNKSYKEYINDIQKVINYIREGDVYQVNISQKIDIETNLKSEVIFKRLYEINPAPFFAYLKLEEYEIISSSPERFIKLEDGFVETRPIKGTINRGKTFEEDEKNKNWLLNSEKNEAELAMIVDLMRNDLGKCSVPGSVKVVEFKRIEKYKNVYHLIGIVNSVLNEGKDFLDLIQATFPGGSITGCPKIRAMEIISEIEKETRGIYTGAIFFKGFGNYFDSNIAIRTILKKNNKLSFRVGGGIVYDSSPKDEYNETIYKGQSILKALGIDNELLIY